MQLNVKTILNFKEKHQKFILKDSRFIKRDGETIIQLKFEPRKNSKGLCSGCDQHHSCYDHLKERSFKHVDLWGIPTEYIYRMRRLNCPTHGIIVEKVPWSDGKSPLTISYAWYLSEWAKLLSVDEVAKKFKTSWHLVFTSVAMAVTWGRANIDLSNITAIGVDEIYWAKGKFMTMVYQIDNHCKRLIWCGEKRKEETLNAFFDWFGEARSFEIKFICSDMWKPYLKVIKARAINALNILDRFHISQKLNEAIDKVRAEETRALLKKGKDVILRKSRYCLLKNPENLNKGQKVKLKELLACNLKSIRAYLLKEDLKHFWNYKSTTWAEKFLSDWCTQVMRSKIEPMKKVAKTIRSHKDLIMNWFEAKNEVSLGAVEGQNNKSKVVIRKSYGFKTSEMLKIMLYHKVGRLPIPDIAHKYF
jgi:transposase